jgi:hypothetical protein
MCENENGSCDMAKKKKRKDAFDVLLDAFETALAKGHGHADARASVRAQMRTEITEEALWEALQGAVCDVMTGVDFPDVVECTPDVVHCALQTLRD